ALDRSPLVLQRMGKVRYAQECGSCFGSICGVVSSIVHSVKSSKFCARESMDLKFVVPGNRGSLVGVLGLVMAGALWMGSGPAVLAQGPPAGGPPRQGPPPAPTPPTA